ncbi:hypothetical protein NP493_413g02030 [Ridgeia piscesae]|uniref:Uncharacterized protein n=1 Tax=Ridgeia piscesae TaxID=27915 RepID=A0AAD9NUE7_RIDPI|nr:hypothetical protein NP493_413g02030 [Ridgeia piscesae]
MKTSNSNNMENTSQLFLPYPRSSPYSPVWLFFRC